MELKEQVEAALVTAFVFYLLLKLVIYLRLQSRFGIKTKSLPKEYSVLITGCDRGFGQLTAEKLDSMGVKVFAGCLTEDGVQRLRKSCSSNVVPFILDVTNDKSVEEAHQRISSLYPQGIFCLINNAGIREGALFDWNDISQPKRELEVNYFGSVRMIKVFLPMLVKNKGRVITIGSLASFCPTPSSSGYTATKFAVKGLMGSLQMEMADFNVDFITIAPGAMKTNMNDIYSQQIKDQWARLSEETKKRYDQKEMELLASSVEKVPKEDPQKVVQVVIKALTSSCPKTLYPVGTGVGTLIRYPWILGVLLSGTIKKPVESINK